MPEEIVVIAVMAILSGSVVSIVRMVLGYRERTRGIVQPPGGEALGFFLFEHHHE